MGKELTYVNNYWIVGSGQPRVTVRVNLQEISEYTRDILTT